MTHKVLRYTIGFILSFFGLILVYAGLAYLQEFLSNQGETKEMVGTYLYDGECSDIHFDSKEDSILFENLSVVFRSDNTFSFSHEIPTIQGQSGTWIIDGFAETDYAVLSMNNGLDYRMGNCCGPNGVIEMSYPFHYRDKSQGYGQLCFKKVK